MIVSPDDGPGSVRVVGRVRETGIRLLLLTPIAFPLLWLLGSTLSWCGGDPGCEPLGYGATLPVVTALSLLMAGAGLALLLLGDRLLVRASSPDRQGAGVPPAR